MLSLSVWKCRPQRYLFILLIKLKFDFAILLILLQLGVTLFQLNVVSTELVLSIVVMPEQSVFLVIWWQLVLKANSVLGERHNGEDQLLTKSRDLTDNCAF